MSDALTALLARGFPLLVLLALLASACAPGAVLAPPRAPTGNSPAMPGPVPGPGPDRGVASSNLPQASEIRLVLPVGSDLADIETDPVRPRAYVADRWNAKVLVVDTDNGTLVGEIPTRSDPVALAVNPAADILYIGHAGNASILAVDLETLAIRRTLVTSFLVWDLAAPSDDSLIATTHDPVWSGQYPYVLNATDGRILDRPCDATCSLVYQDAILALSPDRTRVFFADTAVVPLSLWSFVFDPVGGRWTYAGTSPNYGELGAIAKDLAVSPDNGYVYLATVANSLLRVDAANLTYAGTVGSFTQSATVVVSRTGHRIAMSPYQAAIYLYDGTGVHLDAYAFSARVERLRVTSDGGAFVATVGENVQDVEIVPTTRIQAVWPATTVLPERRPPVVAHIVTFATGDALGGETQIDDLPIPSGLDAVTGFLTGVPGSDLAEGDHTARATAFVSGKRAAETNWSFSIDLTPPTLEVDPIPERAETAFLTVTGRATDPHSVVVQVNGKAAAVDAEGGFSVRLELRSGVTRITIVAKDAAGNEARFEDFVEFLGLGSWYLHPATHFRMRAPWGWYVRGNVSTAEGRVDVIMQDVTRNAALTVRSEAREVGGTADVARDLLLVELAPLASQPGFQYLDPVHTRALGEHPAAGAFFLRTDSGFPVYETRVLVVGEEWGITWTLRATMYAWDGGTIANLANASIDTFSVLPPPAPRIVPLKGYSSILLWVGILAATVEGAVLLSLVVRARRTRP